MTARNDLERFGAMIAKHNAKIMGMAEPEPTLEGRRRRERLPQYQPNAEEMAALHTYAAEHGSQNWRGDLLRDWSRGERRGCGKKGRDIILYGLGQNPGFG